MRRRRPRDRRHAVGHGRRRRRLPGDRRAQVRDDDRARGAEAHRRRRPDGAGHGARARPHADRDDGVVRQAAPRRLALGAGAARRRQADRAQHDRRLPVREDRRARARPDHRDERGHRAGGLRQAQPDRPDGRRREGRHGLLLPLGRAGDHDRAGARQARRGRGARQARQGPLRRRRRRAPRVRGQDGDVQPERLLRGADLRLPRRPEHGVPHLPRLRDQPGDHGDGQDARRAGRRLGRAARRARRGRDRLRDGEAVRRRGARQGARRSTGSARWRSTARSTRTGRSRARCTS